MEEELELKPEIIEYLELFDEETRDIFIHYIMVLNDEFRWLPECVKECGLWYKLNDYFYDNEILMMPDGNYDIHHLDSFGRASRHRISEIFTEWSTALKS